MSKDRHIFGTMEGCTADYLPVTGKLDIKKRPPVWLTFGGPIQESFKRWLAGELAKFKRQDKLCVIELFTALMLREKAADGRDSGGKSYVWETDACKSRKDAFFSPEGHKMQRELIEAVNTIGNRSGVSFVVSFMWEAQVLKGDPRFLPWLREMVAIQHECGRKAGVHSHVIAHYMAADFVVYEGNSAMDLHLVNLSKPVICLRRNVSPFSPRYKKVNFKKSKESLIRLLQGQMLKELRAIGCTAQPFDRYISQKVLSREIGENNFDCSWFKKQMEKFILNISRELKKYRFKELPQNFGQEFVYRRESKPAPAPKLKPKPKDEEKIKTEPIKVEPKEKEKMKNKNPWAPLSLWNLAKSYLSRWWALLIIIPAGVILGAVKAPWWVGLLVSLAYLVNIRLTEIRVQKNYISPDEKLKIREIEPGDYVYSEPVTTLEKPDKCPGE